MLITTEPITVEKGNARLKRHKAQTHWRIQFPSIGRHGGYAIRSGELSRFVDGATGDLSVEFQLVSKGDLSVEQQGLLDPIWGPVLVWRVKDEKAC